VKGFHSFCVGVKGGCQSGEGRKDFTCSWSWERDVFGLDDPPFQGRVFGDIVSRESPRDFGGDRKAGDP